MTIKQKLIDLLNEGHALCHGEADRKTRSQSGGRTLRTIAQDMKLAYFYCEPLKSHRMPFKVFFAQGGTYTLETSEDGFYRIVMGKYASKWVDSLKSAERLVKITK